MPTPPFRPAVARIQFAAYARPLHPELFDLLASRTIQHPDFYLSVWLTPTGHVWSWNDGRHYVTEVTLQDDNQQPHRDCLVRGAFGPERSVLRDLGRGIRYQSTFQMEPLTPELFDLIQGEIRRDGQKRGLFLSIGSEDSLGQEPLSHLTAEHRPGCLFLTGFHTFPEERVVLKTQSLIEQMGR
ncbi:MAG: DUF2617 family protein [Gemmataceae bacterium]